MALERVRIIPSRNKQVQQLVIRFLTQGQRRMAGFSDEVQAVKGLEINEASQQNKNAY